MLQLSNRDREELKTLLETDMDKIGERLDDLETETANIRTELNRVKSRVISILGLTDEQASTERKRVSNRRQDTRSVEKQGRVHS